MPQGIFCNRGVHLLGYLIGFSIHWNPKMVSILSIETQYPPPPFYRIFCFPMVFILYSGGPLTFLHSLYWVENKGQKSVIIGMYNKPAFQSYLKDYLLVWTGRISK